MYKFLLIFLLLTPTASAQDSLTRFHYSESLMGTQFKLTFYTVDQQKAARASEKAFQRVRHLDGIFSDYKPDSEASRLSDKVGQKVTVSEELWYLIKLSKELSRKSKGAFDITIGPLTKLWRRAIRQQQYPDTIKLKQALDLVNYRWLKLYPGKRQVKLAKEGMKLDFGGIAKGYAIDQCYQVLANEGMAGILVDGGGDLFVAGNPPGKQTWDIKDHSGQPIELSPPAGIASSGDSYRRLIWEGTRYSHIIDPNAGVGLKNSSVFTVIANNATIADALATSVGLVTEKHRKKLLKHYQASIIGKDP